MTSIETLASAVLGKFNPDPKSVEPAAFEVHDQLVGFAKGYEDTPEYEFIEAYRKGDPRLADYAGRVCRVEVDAISETVEEPLKEEANGQLRFDI
jgi:hypothetical protein